MSRNPPPPNPKLEDAMRQAVKDLGLSRRPPAKVVALNFTGVTWNGGGRFRRWARRFHQATRLAAFFRLRSLERELRDVAALCEKEARRLGVGLFKAITAEGKVVVSPDGYTWGIQ